MALLPGWYMDQSDSTHEIYWDGSAWTTARREVPQTTASDDGPEAPQDAGPEASERNDLASPSILAERRREANRRTAELAISSASYPPAPNSRRRRSWVIPLGFVLSGVVIGMIIGGLGVLGIVDARDRAEQASAAEQAEAERKALADVFPKAVEDCRADPKYAVVSDGNRTLTIDNEGDEDYSGGLSSAEMWCIIELIDAPASAISHMEQTTARDGRQTEAWENIEASWSYHPDRGMDSIFTIAD